MSMLTKSQKGFFKEHGYLVCNDLISTEEVEYYSILYNDFLDGKIDVAGLRSDLSGNMDESKELITQIMVPSRLVHELVTKPIHTKSLQIAKELLGDDMELDFDMLINKAPGTAAETPWHQDAAYWLDMPDTRAVSCWTVIDRAILDNGCMWYTPDSHLGPVLPHVQVGKGGALKCEGSEAESIFVELDPGSCVFHHGKTLHYSRGNTTSLNRRALITNFRPDLMIKFERDKGYDHTGQRTSRSGGEA